MRYFLLFLLLGIFGAFQVHPVCAMELAEDKTAARILTYFAVGQDDTPDINVTLEQFKSHLEELKNGGYNVLPLSDITRAYKRNRPLPDKAVAITFDGGDKSIIKKATTLLLQYNFPFTVFIATDRVNKNDNRYLNWKDIKNLQKSKLVSLGIHPEKYTLTHYNKTKNYQETLRREINNATYQFRENLGYQPFLFSYVFGAYDERLKDIISSYGFEGAVGQQSGVAYDGSDIFALPRFIMTEDYANIERFRMVLNALPLPVTEATPIVTNQTTPNPAIGFTVSQALSKELNKLRCFASGQAAPKIDIIGENRIELRLKQKITDDRFRVNCTLPALSQDSLEPQKWRWFGILMTR